MITYPDGQEVLAGDVLGEEPGHLWRVVVVVDSRTSVEGYDIEQCASHLKRGVLVEITNPSGVHLVHHADLDEDFELLRRATV